MEALQGRGRASCKLRAGSPLPAYRDGGRGGRMRAVDATLAGLKRAGVDAIFGVPGGPVIPLFDALHDDPDIRTYLVRHEQGAGHAAEGYAKVTGRVGVCTATSGPGATNLVTPIADAYMDSVPLVAITGQVGASRVGTDAFQEADIVGITLPIVKHSYLIKEANDLPQALAEALHVARTGRPGPVLVDVCVDQWGKEVEDVGPGVPRMSGYAPPAGAGHPRQVAAAARALQAASRPVVYAGGGIISGDAAESLLRLAEAAEAPVTTTLMGLGGFPGSHPLWVGMPGMHVIAASTWAFQESDLVLAVGVRFDERVLSTVMNERAPPREDHPHRCRRGRDLEEPLGAHRHRGRVGRVARCDRRRLRGARRRPRPRGPRALARADRRLEAGLPLPGGRGRRAHPAAAGDPVPVRGHAGPGDRLHRRRPAPDVGRPALPVRQPAAMDHLRRARHDGLRPAVGDRRAGGPAGRARRRHRGRRLVRDDPAGALDRADVRPAGEDRDPEQRLPGHGAPVAGAVLGGALRSHELRPVPALLRRRGPRLRHPGDDSARPRRPGRRPGRGTRRRRPRARGRARRPAGQGLPDGAPGQGPRRDDRGRAGGAARLSRAGG